MRSLRGVRRLFRERSSAVPPGFSGVRQWFLCFLALGALALTQPLLDLYGRHPQVFVSSRAGRAQIIAFAVLATLAVPAVATSATVLAGRLRPGADRLVALVFGLVLGATVGLVVARSNVPDRTWAALVLAVAGAVVTIPLLQWPIGRQLLAYVSVIAPLSLALFLFGSATSPLLWQDEAEASDTAIANPAPVVFLQLDELPVAELLTSDHQINADLFPNFARLADRSHWYRNAVSASHATDVSVPSILTGALGENGRDPTSRGYPDNLFTLFGGSYRLNITEDVTDMCPAELCPGPAASFGDLLSDASVVYEHLTAPAAWQDDLVSIDGTWSGFARDQESLPAAGLADLQVPGAADRLDWVDDWQRMINDLAPAPQPALWFAHLRTPHPPWGVNPSGTHYHQPEDRSDLPLGVEDARWVTEPGPSLSGLQRQLFQLGFVDRMLGRMLDRLDESRLWDDAVVVVVADHGNSFHPGDNRRDPTDENVSDIYHIPLFVHLPGEVRGHIHDEPTNAIDVLPTLVEVVDASVDWDFDGRSLLHLEPGGRPHQYVPFDMAGPTDTSAEALGPLVAELDRRIPDRTSWDAVANGAVTDARVASRVAPLRARSGGLRWHIKQAVSLAHVDRRRGIVPTVLTGELDVPEDVTSDSLRVAVNGVIAGTGSFVRTGATAATFYAVLSERLVPDGAADASLLVRDPQGGWLTGTSAELAPEYHDEKGDLVEPGRETRGLRIYVEQAYRTADSLVVEATAFQKITDEPADRFLVYAGNQLLGETQPNADTPAIAEMNRTPVLERTGLRLVIPSAEVPGGTRQITVIAVIGDHAVAEGVTIRPGHEIHPATGPLRAPDTF